MKLSEEEKRQKAYQKKLEYQKKSRQRYFDKLKNKQQSLKSKNYNIAKFSDKMKIMHDKDELFYKSIWNERKHYCQNCGKFLGDDFYKIILDKNGESKKIIINLFRYAHIIPKSIYPFLRHYKNNIYLLCLECHTLFDNSTNEQQQKMKIFNEDFFQTLKLIHKELKIRNINIYK